MMGIGSQPGSSMKLGLAIRAMVAAEVNRLKLFGKADRINRINRIQSRSDERKLASYEVAGVGE
jgi:hypothetical protein